MRLLPVLVLAALAGASRAAPSPRFTDPQRRAKLESALPEIESIFEKAWRQRRAPGMVYGVVIDGEPVVIKGFGVRERKSKDAVTADTVFRIASMTKSFTTLAILKLRDEGKLSLEDPVSKWIPEFARMRYPTADTAPIRVRELLTHGAGFPEDNPWGDRQLGISDDTLTKWLKQGIPFSTAPNTAYEYSNYGFALLGRIVAKASKMPYKQYLTSQILAPLGMTSSTLEPSEVPAAMRAPGYRFVAAEELEEVPLPHGAFGSMGGLLTSGRDLAKYVAYHLSAYPPRDDADPGPVRRSSIREMQSAARPSFFRVTRVEGDGRLSATTASYAYGLGASRDCRFEHIVGHGGGLPGFGSYMQWLPDYGVGMFAMANLTYAGVAAPMNEAWDALLKTGGLKPRELPPSEALTSARDRIAGLWNDWSDSGLMALAADNLMLDRSVESRREEIARLKREVGKCGPPGELEPENWLRGKFRMRCERGAVNVVFTMAPTMPPTVQALSFTAIRPLEPGNRAAAEAVAALFDGKAEDPLAAVAAPGLDRAAVARRAESIRGSIGKCRVGETLMGDGSTTARVRLDCERGRPEITLRLDGGGKLTNVSFQSAGGSPCAE